VPDLKRTVVQGTAIQPKDLSFVQTGVTTEEEVLELLGAPRPTFYEGKFIAYHWRRHLSDEYSISWSYIGMEDYYTNAYYRRWMLVFEICEDGTVKQYKFFKLGDDYTKLYDRVEEWAWKQVESG